MHKLWREFKAPNGKKYYYNTETKKTQWEKPIFKPESTKTANSDISTFQKRVADEKLEAVFVVPLLNDWKLVICNNGSRFFSDPTGKPQHHLDDPQCAELLEYLDKDKLVTLIGFARGYISNSVNADSVYDQLIEEILFIKQDMQVDDGENSDPESESGGEVNETVNGEQDHEQDLEQDSQLIETLNDLSEDVNADSTSNIQQFIKLFDSYGLDKFSTWKREMRKVEKDPAFFLVKDDQLREELFEKWCCGDHERDVGSIDDEDSMSATDDEVELEPTKYHYLSHIVNKSEIEDDTIYEDIRTNQKALFKELRIKDFVKTKKEQQKFVSRLLFYYKKFSLEQRKEVFRKEIDKHALTIKKCMDKNQNDTETYLSKERFDTVMNSNDAFAVETALLQLENLIDIHGDMHSIQETPEYYVLGIKDKTVELFNILRTLHYGQ